MRVRISAAISIVVLLAAPALVAGCHKKPRKGANAPKGGGSASSAQVLSAGDAGAASTNASTTSSAATMATAAAVAGPPPNMTEAERKAIARAAFQEGMSLQEGGKCPDAVPKFEVAQKFYPAPTHALHLAQCEAATGKLVEASENYETLTRTPVTKDMPDAFKRAIDDAKKEGPAVRQRVPTLRITLTPAPSSLPGLAVKVNGAAFPVEVLGIARPINPGKYKVVVSATGYKDANAEVDVGESATKSIDLKLTK